MESLALTLWRDWPAAAKAPTVRQHHPCWGDHLLLALLQAAKKVDADSLSRLVDSLRHSTAAAQDKASALAWGALAVAFLALFIGPVVQLAIAKRQIKATVLSGNRQAWINTLRAAVAEFMALAVDANIRTGSLRGKQGYLEAAMADLARLRASEFRISLALNPNEDDHKSLADALTKTLVWFSNPSAPFSGLGELVDNVRDISRPIFKREWERVKSLS